MSLIITNFFYAGDKHLALDLFQWIVDLGGTHNHDCLFVVDHSTDSTGILPLAQKAFKTVWETPSMPVGAQGKWGDGTTDATAANEMFLTAMIWMQHKFPKRRWMVLEPDACPTRPTWADELEHEAIRGGKPFCGAFVNIPPHDAHMSGNAIYPGVIADYSLDMAIPGKIAWDYAGRRDTIGKKKAHFTDLIQHEYRVDGKKPTFPDQDSLRIIKPRTAVFHRCKDLSLTKQLRIRLNMQREAKEQNAPRELTLEERIVALEQQFAKMVSDRVVGLESVRHEGWTAETKLAVTNVGEIVRNEHPLHKPARKSGKPMKRRPMSAERKEQLRASLAKARAVKAKKLAAA